MDTAEKPLDPKIETPDSAADDANGIREFIREAWSQALVAVNATEEETQKIVNRVSGWVEMGPEEARRLGAELTERLKSERDQLEAGVESAVGKALAPFRFPSKDDLAGIHARVSVLEARVDRLINRKRSRN
jgi:polyhydroxyalkanoate synthesis regulator phasin